MQTFEDVRLHFADTTSCNTVSAILLLKSQINKKKFDLQFIPSKLIYLGNYKFGEHVGQFTLSGAPYLAFDQQRGILYLSDEHIHAIYSVTVATGKVQLVAGSPTVSQSHDGDRLKEARFSNQRAIAVDSFGNLFVSDNNKHTIRKVDFTTNTVTTVCGLSSKFGDKTGTGEEARLYYPNGIAIDRYNNIFVTDSGNRKIKRVTAEGVVTDLKLPTVTPNWLSTAAFSDPFAPDNLYIGDRDSGKVYCIVLDPETHSTVVSVTPIGNSKTNHSIYGVWAYNRKVYVNKNAKVFRIDMDGDVNEEEEMVNLGGAGHSGDLVGDISGSCLYLSLPEALYKII